MTLIKGKVKRVDGNVGRASVSGSKGQVLFNVLQQHSFRPGYFKPFWIIPNGNCRIPKVGTSIIMLVVFVDTRGYYALKWGFYKEYEDAASIHLEKPDFED